MPEQTQLVTLNKYLPDEFFKIVEEAQKGHLNPALVNVSYTIPYLALKRLYEADKANKRALYEWSVGGFISDDGNGHAVGEVKKSDLGSLERQLVHL